MIRYPLFISKYITYNYVRCSHLTCLKWLMMCGGLTCVKTLQKYKVQLSNPFKKLLKCKVRWSNLYQDNKQVYKVWCSKPFKTLHKWKVWWSNLSKDKFIFIDWISTSTDTFPQNSETLRFVADRIRRQYQRIWGTLTKHGMDVVKITG